MEIFGPRTLDGSYVPAKLQWAGRGGMGRPVRSRLENRNPSPVFFQGGHLHGILHRLIGVFDFKEVRVGSVRADLIFS
jgi:hypothetical protein